MSILLLALLAAIFQPARSLSGPSFGPGSIAQSIRNQRLRTGRWPKTSKAIEVSRRFKDRSFSIDPQRVKTGEAIYRIVVDHRDELWRIDLEKFPHRLAIL